MGRPVRTPGERKNSSASIIGLGSAPWGLIARATDSCAKAGIYRIELLTPITGAEDQSFKAWLPTDQAPLEDIRILMKLNLVDGNTIRGVRSQDDVRNDEELLHNILEAVAQSKKGIHRNVQFCSTSVWTRRGRK
jgi:hypothetical protein